VPGYLFPDEHELILEEALSAPAGDFLEVGAWFGKSTSLLAGAVEQRGRDEKVITIDPFTGEGEERDRLVHRLLHGRSCYFDEFLRLAKELGYYRHVVPVATFSQTALAALRARVGFVFLDGDHRREAVERDFALVEPLLVPGARILFHDARNQHYPGVAAALERILEDHPEFERHAAEGTVVAVTKGAAGASVTGDAADA
jgi:predicted O-methyltransferase YrrM